MTSSAQFSLGVIVCCRDEERVIERRLRNLALSQWPRSSRPHVVVVVDDSSSDGTASVAREIGQLVFPDCVRFELISNHGRPGKSGAIASALAQLGSRVDLALLSDADVVNGPQALVELSAAFARSDALGMACGAQVFVDALPSDGTVDSPALSWSAGLHDRLTARVRALESLVGRVFSVHGQLLAWRIELGLAPRSAMAADDLDLMLQARKRGMRVERIAAARFFEVKPAAGALRRGQAVRRARAYLQFAGSLQTSDARDALTLWQWRFYKYVPPALPWIALAAFVLAVLGLTWATANMDPHSESHVTEWTGALICLFWLIVLDMGRRTWTLFTLILEAKHLEQAKSLDDRWSTAR